MIGCPQLKGTARPYVRMKLSCSSPCETQLWTCSNRPLSDQELKEMCSICGESGSDMQELEGDCLTDGAFLPTCKRCYCSHLANSDVGTRRKHASIVADSAR